jgi:CPA1 family monovalent cation:H+ antiporter
VTPPPPLYDLHFVVTRVLVLLLISSIVAMITKWIKVPYTLALVIVGAAISPLRLLPGVHISPQLVLLLFLPALLFDAAWNLKIESLRANAVPLLLLAIPGVCVSCGVIAAILHWVAGMSTSSSLLFGAMISATDPVSVLALFKTYGIPGNLATLVEGESLFNDGTAVVVFRIVLAFVVSTTALSGGQIAASSLLQFTLVILGGVAVGAAIGLVCMTLTSRFNDHLLEIMLTSIAAYGSFLLADSLHVSPVIAVLIAGLLMGNYGRLKGMSSTTQVAVDAFWEYAAFVVNSLVFLLIGLEIHVGYLLGDWIGIAFGILAMVVSRAVTVYGLMPLSSALRHPVPARWQHVLFWGGLRGSLSIALVLSLPEDLPDRSRLVLMVLGTVLFSLLGQGLTVGPLIKRLKLVRPSRPHRPTSPQPELH